MAPVSLDTIARLHLARIERPPGDRCRPAGLWLEIGELTTLLHFSVSSAIIFVNSAAEPGNSVPPRSTSLAFIFGSARKALISLLSSVDDRRRRRLGRADSVPLGRLVAGHGFANRRHVRQRLQAFRNW